ncbi:hypothetical protein QTQ03_05685 [Micromonospora sp. WMMA1363]|uniref:hypothetical protein n=1 Tax=Micromonospora sp. WMMA1363 TaxID=3053985 RepID=UPI00259CB8BD|nr:hypothetical protein [Micromonospora sp. WMMA1363]MDM4719110.1 hypothetical protein [Micromonospora sp. WMMA1363]
MRMADLADGAIAGAVGSTALNAVTYLDMTLRARPASSTPEESARRMADLAHVDLGPEDQATNRRSGLGPLFGYGLGVTAGVAFALLTHGRRLPLATASGLLGGGVMTMSDGTLTALGVADPRSWRRSDWLADLIPHLAFGLAAAVTLSRLRSPRA